jgi:hypothetical protein
MRRTIAAIALFGLSGAALAAPADDNDPDRTVLLGIMGEGTAAIAAAAACGVDKASIERATSTQTELIIAAAVKMGYPEPENLIKIRDEGFKRIREGVERQGSSAHCDEAIEKFEQMFSASAAPK